MFVADCCLEGFPTYVCHGSDFFLGTQELNVFIEVMKKVILQKDKKNSPQ